MNARQLSDRLARVARFVPKGAVVADIGSDHAYLPCYLVHEGVAERAVAGEVVKGPYESAKKQVQEEGLADRIRVRLAGGLNAIDPEDGITAITIAGMGGTLIRSILEEVPEKLEGVERLVLQPNIHALTLREWARDNGWELVAEDILKENNKIYEILVLEKNPEAEPLSPAELLMGPFLMQERSPVFRQKWQQEITQWRNILGSISGLEETEEIRGKKQEFTENIRLAEGVLNDENTERS